MKTENKFAFLTAIFVIALGASNIIASKVVTIFGFAAPAGIIVYPLTFMVTDVVSEAFGKKKAQWVVWTGFAMMLLLLAIIKIAVLLPPASFYTGQKAFQSIFNASFRIILASLAAYIVSQSCDIALFHFLRRLTNMRFLWLRNNASTMISQLVDTIIFILIAFYGVYNFQVCLQLIGGQVLFKFLFAILDTPFVYIGVWWAKGE